MSHFSFLKPTDAMANILFADLERFQPYLEFANQVMRGPSELSEKDRELMVSYVAALNACDFCYSAHSATAAKFGADAGIVEALMADDYSVLDEKLRPAFSLVRKLTKEPHKVVKADIDAITQAGWTEKTAQDVICVTAFMNCSNRIVSGHGINGSPEAFEMAANAMGPGGGYGAKSVKAGAGKD